MIHLNLIIAFILSLITNAPAQCDVQQYTDKCIQKLPQGYTFLKSYKVDGEGGTKKTIEYSYVFSRGTNYMVTLANKDSKNKGIIVTLYDSNRRQLASSFDTNAKEYYSAIGFQCKATGIYYLSFSFADTKDFCAASVLGFKR